MKIVDHGKPLIDAASIAVGVSTLLSWLPHIAALLTVIWTMIRIYEARTVQRLLGKEYHRQGDVSTELEKANDGNP